jgi:hypothetical protein
VASKRQIVDIVETAVLFRNDVFDVVEQFTALLMYLTVFAPFAGPFTDESPRSGIHCY